MAGGKETGFNIRVLVDGLTGIRIYEGDPEGGIRIPAPVMKPLAKAIAALLKTA